MLLFVVDPGSSRITEEEISFSKDEPEEGIGAFLEGGQLVGIRIAFIDAAEQQHLHVLLVEKDRNLDAGEPVFEMNSGFSNVYFGGKAALASVSSDGDFQPPKMDVEDFSEFISFCVVS